MDVPSEFARDIIEPGRRSAETIWSSLQSGQQIVPIIRDFDERVALERPLGEPAINTRIRSITLDSFRAYRDKRTFDLNAPIVVLYGPNGLGKSSVFDAIDFACPGRIGRLCRSKRSADEFAEVATHLDRGAAQAEVFLEFCSNAGEGEPTPQTVRRSVTEWNSAWIKNERFERRSLLQLLTGASGASNETSLSVANLESLFRATHLFGQDDQELLLQFQIDSVIPNDLVSRMLALDDYAAGIAKTESVRSLANKAVESDTQQQKNIRDEIDLRSKALQELKERADVSNAEQPVTQLTAQAVEELGSIAKVSVDSTVTLESVAEWMGVVAVEAESIREREALCADKSNA